MTKSEIEKTEKINKKNNITETPQEIKKRLNNIGFSQVLSYSNSMLEFKINKEDIIKVVDIFVKKYELDPDMSEAIYENIKSSKFSEEDEENEKSFKELEEKYENRKNNLLDDDIDNLRPRAQTISTNKDNNNEIKDSRSKSLKEKTTPYKIIKNDDKSKDKEIIEDKNVIIEDKKVIEIKVSKELQIDKVNKIQVEGKIEENDDNKNTDNNKNIINNKDE